MGGMFPCQCPTTTPISGPAPLSGTHMCTCGGYYAVCSTCRRPLYDGGVHGAEKCSPPAPRSGSAGKSHQWCDRHWAEMRRGVEAGTHNGLHATTLLMQAWMDKHTRAGTLPRPQETRKLNWLLRKDSPLCCTLGEQILADVFAQSRIKAGH